jgi:pyridoxamine 5'-phosphate oxidase
VSGASFDEDDLASEPHLQFARWFADAERRGVPEPEAASLATAALDGRPSVRFVLVKKVDVRGFVFYTNLESAKGEDLAANPRAALAFRWWALERQVRVAGRVVLVPDEESDDYFSSRPRGAQIGAWASAQSRVLLGRGQLEAAVMAFEERFRGVPVPRPSWWGGYRVIPEDVEFWQGRPDRLHDRLRYRRAGATWAIQRLSP